MKGALSAVLDLRRQGPRALDRRVGHLLLRAVRATSRSGRCAGRRPPANCLTSSTTNSCARRSASNAAPAAPDRTVSDRHAGAVRPGLPGRLDGRALSDRSRRRRRSARASRWMRELRELCGQQVPGDTYRNLVVRRDVQRPDLQAHPGAGLAVDATCTARSRIRWSSTA